MAVVAVATGVLTYSVLHTYMCRDQLTAVKGTNSVGGGVKMCKARPPT